MSRDVELRIGELVIDGVAITDHVALGAAVEVELSRLIAEGGVPASLAGGAALNTVDAGRITILRGGDASAVGVQIAQAVYRGLGT